MIILLSTLFSKELFFTLYIQACKNNIFKDPRNLAYIAKVIYAHLGTHEPTRLYVTSQCVVCVKSASVGSVTLYWRYLTTNAPKTAVRALFAHLIAISDIPTQRSLKDLYTNIYREAL